MYIRTPIGTGSGTGSGGNNGGIEPIVKLLFFGMILFTAILIFCEHFFSMDGQIFQVIAGLVTGFSASFFTRIKPRGASADDAPDPKTTTIKQTVDAHTEAQVTPPKDT